MPPNHRDVTLTIPPMSVEATVPDAASALKPFIGSSGLTVTQSVRQSSPNLKVGDSVARTIVVTAQDTPAMLLPPVNFSAADGLAVYPDQPVLSDQADPRSDALTGTRTDQATYMLQKRSAFEACQAWYRRRRSAYLASEKRAFVQLRRAARENESAGLYEALLAWLSHIDGLVPPHSMRGLKVAAQDPILDRELAALERKLFSNEASPDRWSSRILMSRLAKVRRHLRARPGGSLRNNGLPVTLNPQSGDREVWRRRAVAR